MEFESKTFRFVDAHLTTMQVKEDSFLFTKCVSMFPEFDVIFKGSDALERRGAFYTISDLDHPITKLMQSPRKVPRGTSVLLGLNIYKV